MNIIMSEGLWIDDDRFRESNVPVKVIATSSGQRDSGMYELNFNDPRYLPFEGAGAISEWKIELTQDADLRQFDYSTISDVILHMNYTAIEDAGLFKESSVIYLKDFLSNVADLNTQPLMRMFSIKHEFSNEWHKFYNPVVAGSDQILSITIRREHFPFFTKGKEFNIKKLEVLMKTNRTSDYKTILAATDLDGNAMTSSEISMPESVTYANMQKAIFTASTLNANIEELDVFKTLKFKFKHNSDSDYHSIDKNPDEISEMFLVIDYSLGEKV